MTATREELAWAAGFFDGEGCIYFGFNGRVRGGGAVQVTVTNTHRATIDWFYQQFGGRIGPVRVAEGCRPAWRWMLSGGVARRWLSLILPWLHEKAAQAEIARAIPSLRRGSIPLMMEETWQRRLEAAELTRLKKLV